MTYPCMIGMAYAIHVLPLDPPSAQWHCPAMPPVTLDLPDKPKPKRINYALGATMIAQGLTFDQVAPRVGAANGNSLKVGLIRKGVTATIARRGHLSVEGVESAAQLALERVSARTRKALGNVIEKHCE